MRGSARILIASSCFLMCAPLYGQEYTLLAIEDGILWPVNRLAEAGSQRWWLLQSAGAEEAAVPVTVTYSKPFCAKTIESCQDGEWSQQVDVRALESAATKLTPPYYLLNGPFDPAATTVVAMAGEFDTSLAESGISVSLAGKRYRITRARRDADSRIAVTVTGESVAQEVYACETGGKAYPYCGDEGFEQILWCGDLDGDNRLDFVAQFTTKYSMRHYYLFTSSGADVDEHVRIAAEFSRYTN